jgi:hypothetical protein
MDMFVQNYFKDDDLDDAKEQDSALCQLINTIYTLDFLQLPTLADTLVDSEEIDKLYKRIETYDDVKTALPHYLIERSCSKLFNKVILINSEEEGTYVFYPSGKYEVFNSLLSNNLCMLVEESIPDMYVLHNNRMYKKMTLQEYVEIRKCSICQDDDNHKTHVFCPCYHSVCRRCNEKLEKEECIKCPFCRTRISSVELIDCEDQMSMCRTRMLKKQKPTFF